MTVPCLNSAPPLLANPTSKQIPVPSVLHLNSTPSMALQAPNALFTDVVNSMMKELHTLPLGGSIILRLLTSNLNSPILPEIQHLSLSHLDPAKVASLLPALAQMTGLTSLALPYSEMSSEHINYFFTECSALSKLQSLDLRAVWNLVSSSLHLLSQSANFTNLVSLNLQGCQNLDCRGPAAGQGPVSSGLIALLSSPIVKNLQHLNLCSTLLTDPLIYSTIATSHYLSNLVSLDLSDNKTLPNIAALASSTTLVNLTHLTLASNSLGDELVSQLFSPPSLLPKQLQSLNLGRTWITPSSLEVVLKASPHLTELILTGNYDLGPDVPPLIVTSMPNLTKLSLSKCFISNQGYASLAASTTLTNLCELHLEGNRIGEQCIVDLVNSPAVANLTKLNLNCTHDGPEVIAAIAKSPSMSKLQHLDCYENGVRDQGVIALAQSTTLTNLTWLNLGYNGIGHDGIHALCTSPVASKIEHLNLQNNHKAGNDIAAALTAPSSTLYSIVDLDLWGTGMDDESMVQLLASPYLDGLNVLTLPAIGNDSTREAHQTRFGGRI